MNDSPTGTDLAAVRLLLTAAGLQVPEDELARVAAGYPALRARLDAAYDVPVAEATPDLVLRPAPRRD